MRQNKEEISGKIETGTMKGKTQPLSAGCVFRKTQIIHDYEGDSLRFDMILSSMWRLESILLGLGQCWTVQ